MKRIKLAWDDCFARRNRTGSGVYAARLLEHLVRNPALDVAVFDGWHASGRGGSTMRRMLNIAGNMAWTHLDLPLRLWKRGFDLLHSPAFIAPVKVPCPVVITVHDITYLLSIYEGFGFPILEGMAAGTPVASNNQACRKSQVMPPF